MKITNPKKIFNCRMYTGIIDFTLTADTIEEAMAISLKYIKENFKDSQQLNLNAEFIRNSLTEVTFMNSTILNDNSKMTKI